MKKVYKSIVLDQKSFDVLVRNCQMQNIFLIPNPVSLELESIAKEFIDKEKNNEIIFVGHLIKEKGVFELIQAFNSINFSFDLRMIGPAEQEMKIKLLELANQNKEKRLFLEGVLKKEKIFSIIKKCNFLILPSYYEGFPNVILEAMACGCLVLATNVGAIPEMIDATSEYPAGIIIKPRDANSLKESIESLLKQSESFSIMGINGKKKIINSYTLSTIVKEYFKVWDFVI